MTNFVYEHVCKFYKYALLLVEIHRCHAFEYQLEPIMSSHVLDNTLETVFHCKRVLLHMALSSKHFKTVLKRTYLDQLESHASNIFVRGT